MAAKYDKYLARLVSAFGAPRIAALEDRVTAAERHLYSLINETGIYNLDLGEWSHPLNTVSADWTA